MTIIENLPLFPLGTVLFPQGRLPLKIFEARYMDMAKECFRDAAAAKPFGVCLIASGSEVVQAGTEVTVPHAIGCLAHITSWDMPSLGVLHIETRGTERFRIIESRVDKSRLLRGTVELLPADPVKPIAAKYAACASVLAAIVAKIPELFATPHLPEDASWVSNRLAEVLPIPTLARQKLMELVDPSQRIEIIAQFLAQQGLEKHTGNA